MVTSMHLEIFNLSKSYYNFDNTVKVLFEINTSLESSQITFLCGLNGSGKSTLFKAVSGFIKSDNETIIKLNDKIETSKTLRKHVLFVPQNIDDAFINDIFVYEYIKIFNTETVLNYANSINANWIMDLYKSESKILLRELSQGQRQILLLLILLSRNDKVLLLDEVLSSVDSIYSESLWRLISTKIIEQEIISCFITHDYNFAYENAERLIVLYKGKKVLDSRKSEISLEEFISKIKTGI